MNIKDFVLSALGMQSQDVIIEEVEYCKKTLWGVPLGAFQFTTSIYFRIQGACVHCRRMRLSKTHWVDPGLKQMTTGFAEYCGRWMEETKCAAVERMTQCPAMSLWRLDQ